MRMLLSRRPRIAACLLFGVGCAPVSQAQDNLHGDVGIALASHPVYPGSDSHRQHLIPMLRLQLPTPYAYLGNRYGGEPLQLGFSPWHTDHWVAGIDLAYQAVKPRDSSDDERLRGMPDIDRTLLGGAFVAYTYRRYTVHLRADSDLQDRHQGTILTLAVERQIPINPHLGLAIGPQLVWGNRQHMTTFFGLDRSNAPTSTLAEYQPAAGFQERSFNLSAHYVTDTHWILGAGIRIAQLMGDAKDSPLVEKDTQLGLPAFAAYQF